jgi:hypothetical protein
MASAACSPEELLESTAHGAVALAGGGLEPGTIEHSTRPLP